MAFDDQLVEVLQLVLTEPMETIVAGVRRFGVCRSGGTMVTPPVNTDAQTRSGSRKGLLTMEWTLPDPVGSCSVALAVTLHGEVGCPCWNQFNSVNGAA